MLNDFLKTPSKHRNQIKLLIGHVDYGIHRQFNGGAKYITFLREPIERTISHYYFIKGNQKHRYHEAAQKMNINEFILSGIRPRMNNCLTMMISGLNPPYGKCKEEMLEIAYRNIKQNYLSIGFICQLAESVEDLAEKMQWSRMDISKCNVTRNKPEIQSLSCETIKIIRQYNKMDLQRIFNFTISYIRKNGRECNTIKAQP